MSLRPTPKVVALDAQRASRRHDAMPGHRPSADPGTNGAADETADLPGTTRAQSGGLIRAQQTVQDVGAILQTALGAHHDTRLVLQRMRALALLAADASLTASGRRAIQAQLNQFAGEVAGIANGTAFDPQKLLDGSCATGLTRHVGADAIQALAFTLAAITPAALGLTGGLAVGTHAAARRAVATIETAIETVSTQQAELGALINRLDGIVADLRVASEHVAAVKGRITDRDMAAAATATLRAQLLQQPETAWLAQANALPGILLQFPAQPPA